MRWARADTRAPRGWPRMSDLDQDSADDRRERHGQAGPGPGRRRRGLLDRSAIAASTGHAAGGDRLGRDLGGIAYKVVDLASARSPSSGSVSSRPTTGIRSTSSSAPLRSSTARGQLGDRGSHRNAALDRDRALPHRAGPAAACAAVATLVELLAAIPSVILGLWGILVLGPFMQDTIEPALQTVLGLIPSVRRRPSPFGLLPAAMHPDDHDGADRHQPDPGDLRRRCPREPRRAPGARRHPLGDDQDVVLPYSRPGIIAAVILGLGGRSARRSPSLR